MKICIAQISPVSGDIRANIALHESAVSKAIAQEAHLIVFPELSLTGYEPQMAKDLAVDPLDELFDPLQKLCEAHTIVICAGMPTISPHGIQISTLVFQPGQPRKWYSKQYLHHDELPYFVAGSEQLVLSLHGRTIAPSICYESTQKRHVAKARALGADIYLVSVAKSEKGIQQAYIRYPDIARKYGMHVVVCNSTGACGEFISAGKSAVWDLNGSVVHIHPETPGIQVIEL